MKRTVILIVLVMLNCLFANPALQGKESNIRRRYRDPLLPLLKGGLIGPQEKTLIFSVRSPDGKIPPQGPKLEILSSTGRIVLNSDTSGFIRFPFNLDLVRENPTISKLGDENYVFEARLTSSARKGVTKRIELSAKGKDSVGDDSIRVWYPPGSKMKADLVLKQCRLAYRFIHTELGVTPPPWGVNLIREDLSEANQTTLQAYPQWYTWSYPIEEALSSKGKQVNTHEWVEYTLEQLGIEQSSSPQGSNRFVLDGLSEYLSIRFTGYMPSDYLSRLTKLVNRDITVINLAMEFKAPTANHASPDQLRRELERFTAGYPLSYVFWEHTSSEYGRDLPKRFINKIQKLEKVDYETCIHTLEELTGASLKHELEAMDLHKAVQLINHLSKNITSKNHE